MHSVLLLCRDGLRHFECDTNQIRTGDNPPASVGAGKTLYSAIGRELGEWKEAAFI